MVIDFSKIVQQEIEGFKGGKGILKTQNFTDDKCKIMFSELMPGASTGLHVHERNSEIIYILKGQATFHYDGNTEKVSEGQVHYCPMGHQHYMMNETKLPLVYFAIVPEHHL